MTRKDLDISEYNAYYEKYIDKSSNETTLKKGLNDNKKMLIAFFSSISTDKLTYRYQPKKWTIKELLQHIIDTERIFIYRFLRIARKDATPLAGFDQDIYVTPSGANLKSIDELISEFTITRAYTINLVNSISDENLKNTGTASNTTLSARACAFILLGHSIWHVEIIKERYL